VTLPAMARRARRGERLGGEERVYPDPRRNRLRGDPANRDGEEEEDNPGRQDAPGAPPPRSRLPPGLALLREGKQEHKEDAEKNGKPEVLQPEQHRQEDHFASEGEEDLPAVPPCEEHECLKRDEESEERSPPPEGTSRSDH